MIQMQLLDQQEQSQPNCARKVVVDLLDWQHRAHVCFCVCVYAHVCPWCLVCLKKKDQILWIYGLLCRRKTKLLVLSESLWK